MTLSEHHIATLVLKHIAQEINAGEEEELQEYVRQSPANKGTFTNLAHIPSLKERLRAFYDVTGNEEESWELIKGRWSEIAKQSQPRRHSYTWMPYAAAALVIITLGAITYWLTSEEKKSPDPGSSADKPSIKEVQPGGNKAILTLANGSTIALDSARTGLLAEQGNIRVTKIGNGQLQYRPQAIGGLGKAGETAFNTLATPRGGQYQVTLPDGTKVWLNAASSIRYPAVFTGSERMVYVSGEAYFEVAHDLDKKGGWVPFKVEIPNSDASVEVLGTHFNINAYTDEAGIRTTLLEGSVRMNSEGGSSMLQPGQQGVTKDHAAVKVVNDVDLEEVMAWKNGRFVFDGASIDAIMRQLSRWYDLEVRYEGAVTGNYTGKIPMNVTLNDVFKILEATTKVQFRIEGKKVTVIPVE